MGVSELAVSYERNFGSVEFLKAVCSAVNKVLVNKGVVTQDELGDALSLELQDRIVSAARPTREQEAPQRATRDGCAGDPDFKVLAGKVEQLWTDVYSSSVSDLEGNRPKRQTLRGAVLGLVEQNNAHSRAYSALVSGDTRAESVVVSEVEPPKPPWAA